MKTEGQKLVAREAARIVKTSPPPSHGRGVILAWIEAHGFFILIVASNNVSWDDGYTAARIDTADAVKMELLIAEKTKPIIEALATTARRESLNLVGYGRKYYDQSGSIIGALYHETGERSDWGKVNIAIDEGIEVNIRPATEQEHAAMALRCEQAIAEAKRDGWSGPWDLKATYKLTSAPLRKSKIENRKSKIRHGGAQ